MSRRFALLAVAVLIAVASVTLFEIVPRRADARPGGGQTFGGSPSGGSRSSGSGSSGSRSSGSGSRSNDSWGGSSRSSSSDRDSSWSERPSYSSPWSDPTPPPKATTAPRGSNPHGGSYSLPRPNTRPRGSMLDFFFWIIAGLAVLAAALQIAAIVINRRIESWVEDGRRSDTEWESGIEDHIPALVQLRHPDEAAVRQLGLRAA
ncbi:MAG: hypothetical protein JNK04_11505, partial [Myxococcales bacterium]|nr:hypothetical protein [Myxococcales bacterium]